MIGICQNKKDVPLKSYGRDYTVGTSIDNLKCSGTKRHPHLSMWNGKTYRQGWKSIGYKITRTLLQAHVYSRQTNGL